MFKSLQSPMALLGGILIALLFVSVGFHRLSGSAHTAAKVRSAFGALMGRVRAVVAVILKLGVSFALLVDFPTLWM